MTTLVIGICIALLLAVIYISAKPISMGIEARRNLKNKDGEYEEDSQMSPDEDVSNTNSKNISDEIIKLNKLMNEGIITRDEYEKEINKLFS